MTDAVAAMTESRRGGAWRLAAILITAIAFWGWLFPWISTWPATRQRIENTERLGINPSAIYYTDIFRYPADFPTADFPKSGFHREPPPGGPKHSAGP
jgi:hypothetical protein